MKRLMRFLILFLLIAPLTLNAETITWVAPTTYTDGSAIDAATKAALGYYLRASKEGSTAKTYFGETRNGVVTWTDNILVRVNAWGVTNAVPGWVALKVGDNVLVTLSTTYKDSTGTEIDGPESPSYRWTLPGAVIVPPLPPKPSPSCNAPTGITIR
jgi:hypothetical protein